MAIFNYPQEPRQLLQNRGSNFLVGFRKIDLRLIYLAHNMVPVSFK